jgi:hypothetical protein
VSAHRAGEKTTTGGLLFSVSNHHTASSGEPPVVDGDAPDKYFGYFANEHGEQAIYAYDFATGEATLRMGDAGWQTTHAVVNGEAQGLMLSMAEFTWLRACWMATGGRASPRGPHDDANPPKA